MGVLDVLDDVSKYIPFETWRALVLVSNEAPGIDKIIVRTLTIRKKITIDDGSCSISDRRVIMTNFLINLLNKKVLYSFFVYFPTPHIH